MGEAGSLAQDEASNSNSADNGPQNFILEMGEPSLEGQDRGSNRALNRWLRIEAIVHLKESERVLVLAPRRNVIEHRAGSFFDLAEGK